MPVHEKLGRFASEEFERSGGRKQALARIGALNHAARILDFLARTLAEYEEASTAFLPTWNSTTSRREENCSKKAGDSRSSCTIVWAASGDAGIAPGHAREGEASVTLRELLDRLEEYVAEVVDYLDANRTS